MPFVSSSGLLSVLLAITLVCALTSPGGPAKEPLLQQAASHLNITSRLFADLEESARIVDITYCVGITGVSKPFQCLSRCQDFPNFELVTTWNTGPLLSDSCGFIALDHHPLRPRIIVAFRGTYSVASAVVDLSTRPQEYTPYVPEYDKPSRIGTSAATDQRCDNCTVHSGFMQAWRNTRTEVLERVTSAIADAPGYRLTLLGHSLGGAVALLAALELDARGLRPRVTTFGEPRVGNAAFVKHVDDHLLSHEHENGIDYRRVTHVDDPVPLLPLTEWGYRPHAGEIYISKPALPPAINDLHVCRGDNDQACSSAQDTSLNMESSSQRPIPAVPTRFRLWALLSSHRDYFWRLGLCVKVGDPWNWKGDYDHSVGDLPLA